MTTLLAALMVGGGLAMVTYGIALRGRRRRQELKELLEVELLDQPSPEVLAGLVEHAGVFAERVLGKTSIADRIRVALSQAGWSLKAGELGVVLLLAGLGGGALGGFLTTSALAGVVAAGATPVAIMAWLSSRGRRVQEIEAQLPSILQLLAGSLDSGASLLLAMELAGSEGDPPLAPELTRVVAETRVGRPLLESLEAMAQRVGSQDVAWTVEAIRIQQATGGKLADTLRVLADFMRTRLEVRGEVRALSAEARISGKILIFLPVAIGSFLFLARRAYLEPLLTTGPGKVMLALAAIGIIWGSLWMRRLVRVEV
ncbi:MAG: type II secretion system F family protein [Actinomycetota bacterium]